VAHNKTVNQQKEHCEVCLREPRRSHESKLCNTCYTGLERFFLMYYSSPMLRGRLPDDIRIMLIDVVLAIKNAHGVTSEEVYALGMFEAVLRASTGRAPKLPRQKAVGAE
jgi:hypothetical protein